MIRCPIVTSHRAHFQHYLFEHTLPQEVVQRHLWWTQVKHIFHDMGPLSRCLFVRLCERKHECVFIPSPLCLSINFLLQAPPPTSPVFSSNTSALSFFPLPLSCSLLPPPKVGYRRTSGESQAALRLFKPPRRPVETISRRSIVSPEPQKLSKFLLNSGCLRIFF